MNINPITLNNIENIKTAYEKFCTEAVKDYAFEIEPLNFDQFILALEQQLIKGYFYQENNISAFLIYSDCLNDAIEINLIYCDETPNKIDIKKALTSQLINDLKSICPGRTISYPMLGKQADFIEDIVHLDFRLIGECIFELEFFNSIQRMILGKSKASIPQSPYNADMWRKEYFDAAAKIIYERFSKLNDAKFDPRFQTLEGSIAVLKSITEGDLGTFIPELTTVVRYENTPIGFCFVNLTTPDIANIPIFVIDRAHNHKGLGLFMLKQSTLLTLKAVQDGAITTKLINATCDTNNYPAIHSYRRIGFKEKTNYAHAYRTV
ncbi:MAG: hypothetical protein PHX18_00235 [Candidatus Gastranaerophilales bacterium]|nr:hypothetical protein [Candidatus Gastranaerophilales bacterium]